MPSEPVSMEASSVAGGRHCHMILLCSVQQGSIMATAALELRLSIHFMPLTAEDVTKDVARHNCVEGLRVADQLHRRIINVPEVWEGCSSGAAGIGMPP